MIIIPENSKKLNEYDYYHIRIFNRDQVIFENFDLSFKDAFDKINKIISAYDFIVIATIDKIDDCIRCINGQCRGGIVLPPLQKEDVFKSKEGIFVNCTDYFKKTLQK